ncbi:extracellular solute-binding protein [Paracoccus sp. (in: a-proteobacteria)]|uniref:extracellular solute-binding protein n=1 Tax=Paracoccus sp. TaxID=267 RepID=UPI0039E44A62
MTKTPPRTSPKPLSLPRFARLAPALAALALCPGLALAQDAAPASGNVVATGISVFGTPELPPDFKHLRYVNPDAPKGGEISEWASGGFDSYNPYTHRGRAAALSSAPLEALMEPVADETGATYCLLCESIEYPPSRDWVIFNLRPQAKFSDGTPLTAHDVLFSFEILRDKGLSSYRTVIAKVVAKAEVLDDRRIKFYFRPDYPRREVIQAVGGQIVFSREDFRKNKRDIEQSSGTPFLGSGPYVFERADMGRSVSYRRNPDYWGKDLPINVGRHNFDRIRIEYFADYDSAFEAFKAGAYTFRNEASSIHWATRYDFPAMKSGVVKKESLPDGSIASGQAWVFNLRREKFQDIRVREAVGLLFNFEWANETLFYGLYQRVNSPWDNSDLMASGPPSAAELALLEPVAKDLPPGVLTDDAVVQPQGGKTQLDRGNMRRAAKLLDEAGWKVGNDGMRRNGKGEVLRIEFLNDSPTFDRVINPFVQNLRAAGIDAVNTRVDDAELTNRTRSHDFDLVTAQIGQAYILNADTEQTFGSENVGDVFNPMGLANPAVDRLIQQGIAADTQEKMDTAIHALDRALRSLRFWVPQWFKPEYTVAYYDQFAHPLNLPPYALGELDFWWYDADKAEKLKQSGALR